MRSLGFIRHNKTPYEHFFDKNVGMSYLIDQNTKQTRYSVTLDGFLKDKDGYLVGKIHLVRDTSAAGHHYDFVYENGTLVTHEIGMPGAEKTVFRFLLNHNI